MLSSFFSHFLDSEYRYAVNDKSELELSKCFFKCWKAEHSEKNLNFSFQGIDHLVGRTD